MSGSRRLKIQVRVSPNGKSKGVARAAKPKVTGVSASRREHPQSTNVSSPIQAAARRRNMQEFEDVEDSAMHRNGYQRDNFVVSDAEDQSFKGSDEDEEVAFEPIRKAGKRQTPRKRQLGPPVTTDEKLDRLNETHRMVVDDFVINAKKECEKVSRKIRLQKRMLLIFQLLISKGLRDPPFTDSLLREMAINFPKGTLTI